MQIKKSKGVVSIKLTQYEQRQLVGAQDIIDTVRSLGGTVEDVDALITGDGSVVLGGNSDDSDDTPADVAGDTSTKSEPDVDAPARKNDQVGPKISKPVAKPKG